MNKSALFFLVVGITLLIFPDIIAYILGGTFLVIGASLALSGKAFGKKTHTNDYFKFGEYKIYKNKK